MTETKNVENSMVPSINVLNTSNLVKSEDVDFLKQHSEEFEKRYRTRSYFRSKTEMEAGVLSDEEHPTVDSKYWQAIGEQNVHLTELISLDYEAKKLMADMDFLLAEIDELEEICASLNEGIEKRKEEAMMRKKKIEHDQKKFNLMQMEKTAQERMREVKTWEPIIQDLHKQLKYGDEDFGLHHAERYYLRYKKRMERIEMLSPEEKESVVKNFLSFDKHLKESNDKGLIPPNIPPGISSSSQIDYKNKEELDDPIAKKYFDRKVRRIIIASPHRNNGDRNATNFNMLQPPAGFNCELMEPYGYNVPDARNHVVKTAIEEGADYIFFVDDDVIIPRNALIKLLKNNADVVGGMYYRKYFPLETVGMHETEEGMPCSIDDYTIGDIIHNTLVLPSGCTLIKVEALKKIEFPWYKTITVNGRPTLTEDTYLCQKMRDIGVDIITDTGVQCVHVDFSRGIFYGHPELVDQKINSIKEQFRDYLAI
jgi:hypothetical protein